MPEPLLATEANPTPEGQSTEEVTVDSSSTETTEQTAEVKPTEEPAEPTKETKEVVEEKPEGAPETYEFTSPDGFDKVDAKIHDAYAEAARDLDLPQEKAQGLFSKTMTALHERAVEEQDKKTAEWRKTAEADSEYGGAEFEKNMATAKKAAVELGSEGLRELLNDPNGIGNHPEVIRFLFKIGTAVSEDRFVGSGQGPAVSSDEDAAMARRFYPTSSKT